VDFTLIAGLLGRKRGIFVLVADSITNNNSAMNTNAIIPDRASQEITRSRRIGFLVYPDCDIVDVCGPCDAFHYAELYLRRFGRINEPGYLCNILAAAPGLVRTSCGIELIATHSYCDVRDSLDTLVVAGGQAAEQVSKEDPALVERWAAATAKSTRSSMRIEGRGC
jgi:transcriptional regulator GlxA family with amidase domain